MPTPQERIAAGQELRKRGKLSADQDAALKELERRYNMAPAPASGKRGGMVTEGTISREEYMRQRGPVNEAAPSAPDGSLIPMASRGPETLTTLPETLGGVVRKMGGPDLPVIGGLPVSGAGTYRATETPGYKPVVSEDMLRPGPMGMNMAATSQALETPQALRSEKMTMAQSAALGVNDLNPVRLATGDRGYEAAMTRSLEDNPVTTRVGQTAALTAGGGAQLTNRALVYAPKLVAPAVAARFAGNQVAQYLGRGAVLAGTGVADFYGYNALAEAPNQARMAGAPSPTMGQRIDYANSQVFTPAGLISAGLPVAGSVIARGVRGGIAAGKNKLTTGSATTRTLPGGGTAQVSVSNLFTPASVQRSVAAGQAINAQSKSARGRTAREEAIDLLIAKGIDADETEKLAKLISYDNYTTVDEMLFELANADIDQLAVAAARVGGDAKKTFREAFKARNAEMPERIRTQLRDAMALSGDELEDFAAQMAARADEATADGYAAAYAQQISDTTWGKMWDRLSVSPDAREAIAAGARLARNSYRGNPAQLEAARQLEQLASALDSPSAIPPKLSTHALDYLDRGFGSLIAGQKKNNPAFASSLIEIQKALRDAGLDADTGLAGPRQVYSQFKAAGRALEFGAKAFGRGTSLKDLKKQFAASLKDADEVFEDIVGEGRSVVDQALIMGWLRGAEDAIETATNPGALIRQIYGSERQRAKLIEMMPSETDVMTSGVKGDQTKRIKALVGSELGKEDYTFNFGLGSGARAEGRRAVPSLFERQRTMLENQGRVSGNSVTGDVNEAIANQGGLQRGADLLARTLMNPQDAARNAVLWAVQRVTTPAIFKPEVNRELGRILTTRGREQILEIVAEIRARQAATGKGPKPPTAPGTPPRGTPPSGSPPPSPNALAPQGPIRAAGFGGFGGKKPPVERTQDAIGREIKDIEKQLRRKGYTLNEAETLAEEGNLPPELRGLMIQHGDLVRESGRMQGAAVRAKGGVETDPEYLRAESEMNKAMDDVANAEYEIARELRERGLNWEGDDAEFMGVVDQLRREGKLSNYLASRVEDLRAASTRMFDAEAKMRARVQAFAPKSQGAGALRGDLGNALAGAGIGAAGPADSTEERLRNIGIGIGVGLTPGAIRLARQAGRNINPQKLGTRTADAAAITTLAAGGPTAEADTGSVSAEVDAANERVRVANDRVLQIEKTAIPQLEADLRLLEDPNADPRKIQTLLANRDFDLGPNGVDGRIGPDTRKAIASNVREIKGEIAFQRGELEKARKEEEKARQGVKDANMRAALKNAEPNPVTDMATKAAQGAAFLAGTYAAYRLRKGAVKAYEPIAKASTRKANALVNTGKMTAAKTGPNALNTRAANINEFWKMGGAGKNVPFQVNDQGVWSARAGAKEPSQLFRPPRYMANDVKFMAGAGVEAGASKYAADHFAQEAEKAEADMQRALEAGDDIAFNAALDRKKSAEGAEAFARILERLGYGAMAGRALSGLVRYPAVKANVNAADAERALLLQSMTKQKPAAKNGQGQGNP